MGIQNYNHTAKMLQPGGVSTSDTWLVILLDSNAVFDADHTTIAEATNSGAWEVFGNGWSEGGEEITNVSGEISGDSGGAVTADDIRVKIFGGDLGPFDFYLLCANGVPLSFVTLTAPKTVLRGYYARIPWTDGVLYSSAMGG